MTSAIVLSVHALSDTFRGDVERLVGSEPEYIALSTVRPKGAVGGLRFLMEHTPDAVYVVVEEPEEIVMLPIISLASLFVRARKRFAIDPEHRVTPVGLGSVVNSVFSVLFGSLNAVKNGIVAFLELNALESSPRANASFAPDARIVYLNTNVNFGVKAGGSLGHIAGVVNDLHRRGADLLYVATRRFSVIDADVPIEKLRIPSLLGIPMDLFLFGFGQQAYRQLRRLFATGQKPSIIYQRMSRDDYTGAKLSKKHNVPFIIEYNGSEAWGARHWGHPMLFERLARKAELVSLRSANLAVTISEVLAEELVTSGIPRERIVVYPNCVDSDVFDATRFGSGKIAALRASLGIPNDATVFGFIGTFGKWHGVDIMCEAIRNLASDSREWLDRQKIRFLIIGDGYHGSLVESLVRNEATQRYVAWPGLVEQKQAPLYLAAIDILLSPHVQNPDGTRFFGSPTKLFEYMSMCRPIIASRLEQIEHVLNPSLSAAHLPQAAPTDKRNELAILAEPGNAKELVTAMRFLAERRDWREVLARNARAEVIEKYQWRHHVGRILAAIYGSAKVRTAPQQGTRERALTESASYGNDNESAPVEISGFAERDSVS